MRALLLRGCALLLLASCPAFATTYLVGPDSSGDFPNIQAAIDAAASGDTWTFPRLMDTFAAAR